MRDSRKILVYFDNAATSYPKPESVIKVVNDALIRFGGNPGRGSNRMSLASYREIFKTREAIAGFFNVKDSSRIVFTSNATESLNLAIKGLGIESGEVITTSMEHNSVIRPLSVLASKKVVIKKVKCSEKGEIELDDFKKMINRKTKVAVFTHASNVVGTILPIEEIGKICRDKGIVSVVDASQTAGHIHLNVERLNVDLLACSGHKGLLGTQGTGLLYIAPSVNLTPLKEGGTGSFSEKDSQPEQLPDRFESGTMNTPGILSLRAGVEFIKKTGLGKIQKHEKSLIKRFISELKGVKGVSIYGSDNSEKRAGLVSFNIDCMPPSKAGEILDRKFGIMVRTGLHCSPDSHRVIGSYPAGCIRLSPGFFNTLGEIDYVIKAVKTLIR